MRNHSVCMRENLMSNNFRRTAVLKKILIVNESYKARDCTKKFGGVPVLKFLQRLALDFHIFVCNFSREFLTDKCIENLKKRF